MLQGGDRSKKIAAHANPSYSLNRGAPCDVFSAKQLLIASPPLAAAKCAFFDCSPADRYRTQAQKTGVVGFSHQNFSMTHARRPCAMFALVAFGTLRGRHRLHAGWRANHG
jgi:hypothetical protein